MGARQQGPSNWGDHYGMRIRGYLQPTASGSYIFWLATDDDGELWLSTDDQPSSKQRIASISGWTSSREWNKYPSQKSAALTLVAGRRYYLEVLQKEGVGGDNLAVGWATPGQDTTAPSEVVPGSVLSGFGGTTVETSPWANRDVGSTGMAGSTSSANETFTVSGSDADIWGTADAFQFASQPLTGDGTIVARIGSMQNTDAWAKAGVMMREGTAAGAMHAFCGVTAANGVAFQRRIATNGNSSHTGGSPSAALRWVKLVRQASLVTGFESADGVTWIPVGSATINMANPVQVGLAVTSHNASVFCTAVFDNVLVIPGGNG